MRMKKEHVAVPRPRSMFLLVQCTRCGTERIVYSHTNLRIVCSNCSKLLAESSGGKAIIHDKILARLDADSSSQLS
jgi:small subunit ribosomal protein S27e